MPKIFLKRNWNRHSKLGKRRNKKQKWRRPKGRHNKMRENRKGYPAKVKIGYKKKNGNRGWSEKKKTVIIKNLNDLEKVKEGNIAIIGKVGLRKKMDIAKKALELKIKIYNLNVKKFLKRNEKNKRKGENVK